VVEVADFNVGLVWLYYAALALTLWLLSRRPRIMAVEKPPIPTVRGGFYTRLSFRLLLPALVVVAMLASVVGAGLPDDKLHVSFLDVGQGDAILIQTPAHHDILVDGGPSPQAINLELGRKMPFWDRTIDLVVLTHPQADHLTGLIEVLKRYNVKQVLYPAVDYDSLLYQEWFRLIEEKGIEATLAVAGQRIDLEDGVEITVLNPPAEGLAVGDANNQSLALSLSFGDFSFLLTGDVQLEAELEMIMQRAVAPATVLKVAHHGSATSTIDQFLAVAAPQMAIISVGADNSFGHPTEEVMARLEEAVGFAGVYRTDTQGTIEFVPDGESLWVKVVDRP
jgi:competence protein ComEC